MNDHPHPHDDHEVPEPALDAGSQALSDALKSSFGIVRVILVIMVIVFLGSGFFTVGTQEKALILRFGKPVGEGEKALLGPGPHWALPAPIDEVVKIPIGQVQVTASTIGWYATTAAKEAAGQFSPFHQSLAALDQFRIARRQLPGAIDLYPRHQRVVGRQQPPGETQAIARRIRWKRR